MRREMNQVQFTHSMLDKFLFLLWLLAWSAGGLLLASATFRLPRRLVFGAGLALGAVTQAWFANLLGFVLPAPLAFGGGALVTLALGVPFAWPLSWTKIRRALVPA